MLDVIARCEGGNICELTKEGFEPKPLDPDTVRHVVLRALNQREGVQKVGEGKVLGYVDPPQEKPDNSNDNQGRQGQDGKYSWQRKPGRQKK